MADGVVYAGSDDMHLYALDAATGEMLWSFETGDVIRSTPTVTGGAVYFGSNDNHVYALDAQTGEMLWSHDTGNWVQHSPVVSGGAVYIGAAGMGGIVSTPSTQHPESSFGLRNSRTCSTQRALRPLQAARSTD